MTPNKTEAQPEALRLAAEYDYGDPAAQGNLWKTKVCNELRRQHAEIQQLKAEKQHALDVADAQKEHIEKLEAQLITQTNRAATAEQQVTALTQRLDMANRLNTDARELLVQLTEKNAWLEDEMRSQCNIYGMAAEQLAQVHADHQTQTVTNKTNSSKCVIDNDVQWKCGNEYLPYHPDASHVHPAYRDGWNDCYRAGEAADEHQKAASLRLAEAFPQAAEMFHPLYVQGFKAGHRSGGARGKRSVLREVSKLVDDLLASPAPTEESNSVEFEGIKTGTPEREPLTDEQIFQLFIEMYGQEPAAITEFAEVCRRVEAAHGIGATNAR